MLLAASLISSFICILICVFMLVKINTIKNELESHRINFNSEIQLYYNNEKKCIDDHFKAQYNLTDCIRKNIIEVNNSIDTIIKEQQRLIRDFKKDLESERKKSAVKQQSEETKDFISEYLYGEVVDEGK